MLLPSDVFDQPQPVGNKRIEFHISTDMPAAFKKDLEKEQNCEEKNHGKDILVISQAEINFFFVLELSFTYNVLYFSVCQLYLKYAISVSSKSWNNIHFQLFCITEIDGKWQDCHCYPLLIMTSRMKFSAFC